MAILYKFLSPERTSYFKNECLRFSCPGALNDPFECLPALTDQQAKLVLSQLQKDFKKQSKGLDKRQKKSVEESCNIPKTPSDVRDAFYKRTVDKMNSLVGIFSMSETWNISLMWSHYTESHKGFCIGFDDQHDFFSKGEVVDGEIIVPFPVQYSSKRTTAIKSDTTAEIARSVLATKAEEWSYEKEHRAIKMLKRADEIIKGDPFDIHLFRVPHDAVVEIIVGVNSSKELVDAAIEFGRKLNVPIYKSEISSDTFNFIRTEL